MPRPTSKTQLLEQSIHNYEALQAEIKALTDAEIIESGVIGEWSVKDVLAHLMAWQDMALAWYQAGKRGETPITPSEKFTWREIPALNQEIYEIHRDWPLDQVRTRFTASHTAIMTAIKMMTNEELFTPKVYAWTKSTTLGSYMTSATSSHYAWARKEIRRGLRVKRTSADE